jgi:hypothetical protein
MNILPIVRTTADSILDFCTIYQYTSTYQEKRGDGQPARSPVALSSSVPGRSGIIRLISL